MPRTQSAAVTARCCCEVLTEPFIVIISHRPVKFAHSSIMDGNKIRQRISSIDFSATPFDNLVSKVGEGVFSIISEIISHSGDNFGDDWDDSIFEGYGVVEFLPEKIQAFYAIYSWKDLISNDGFYSFFCGSSLAMLNRDNTIFSKIGYQPLPDCVNQAISLVNGKCHWSDDDKSVYDMLEDMEEPCSDRRNVKFVDDDGDEYEFLDDRERKMHVIFGEDFVKQLDKIAENIHEILWGQDLSDCLKQFWER